MAAGDLGDTLDDPALVAGHARNLDEGRGICDERVAVKCRERALLQIHAVILPTFPVEPPNLGGSAPLEVVLRRVRLKKTCTTEHIQVRRGSHRGPLRFSGPYHRR